MQTLHGTGAENGAAHAQQLFSVLSARVTDPLREPRYDSARVKIAHAVFIPSRVWGDTAVWTTTTANQRTHLAEGRYAGGRYRIFASHSVPRPAEPAQARHLITLTKLGDGEFAWDTEVPFSLGSVPAATAGRFIGAIFAAAEGRDERRLRAEYRRTLPTTTAALSQLFRLDSIRTTHLADSSTLALYGVTLTVDGLKKKYPNFEKYMRSYAQSARIRWLLSDDHGVPYLEASAHDGKLMMRVRTKDGAVVSLLGPARPIPDTLQLRGDFLVKISGFRIGFRDGRFDMILTRTAHERAMRITARVEPEWDLPLFTERLLRTPLRRPFEGEGAYLHIGIRDSAGAQTLLTRRVHVEVQESAILRFLSRLGATAVGDYQGKAEREQYAWLKEVFEGLERDAAVMR